MTVALSRSDRFLALRELISLGRGDLMYADQYMYRGEALLQELCSREQYARLSDQRRRLGDISAQLDGAIRGGDW